MPVKADKDLKLYYSIGEVAEMFGVNDTLLRFWEREFPQIAPKKGARGIRQYTKRDIETVRVVYNLVKVRGLRIEAAREALRNNDPYGQIKNRLRLRCLRLRHPEVGGQMPFVWELEHDEGIFRRSRLAFARRGRRAAGRTPPRNGAPRPSFQN